MDQVDIHNVQRQMRFSLLALQRSLLVLQFTRDSQPPAVYFKNEAEIPLSKQEHMRKRCHFESYI